ncbi:histone-like protein [Streptomyces sp. NPDC001970]
MDDAKSEAYGYTLTKDAEQVLNRATSEYAYEILVKARLVADGRKSKTVTGRDVTLAIKSLSSDPVAYYRISKKSVFRSLLVVAGLGAGALTGYVISLDSGDKADLIASAAAALISMLAAAATFSSHRQAKESAVQAASLARATSSEARTWEVVQAWQSIEQAIQDELKERDSSRNQAGPLGEMLRDYADLYDLGPEFRESLRGLIDTRNRIAHGMPVDLTAEKYAALMKQAHDAMDEIDRRRARK